MHHRAARAAIAAENDATSIPCVVRQGIDVALAASGYDQKLIVGLLTAMCKLPLEVKTLTTVLAEL